MIKSSFLLASTGDGEVGDEGEEKVVPKVEEEEEQPLLEEPSEGSSKEGPTAGDRTKQATTSTEKEGGEEAVPMEVDGDKEATEKGEEGGVAVKEEDGADGEAGGEGEGGEREEEYQGPELTPEEEMHSVELSRLLHNVLSAIYGGSNVEVDPEAGTLTVKVGAASVVVSYAGVAEGPRLHVEAEDHLLRDQVAQVTSRVLRALGDHE